MNHYYYAPAYLDLVIINVFVSLIYFMTGKL